MRAPRAGRADAVGAVFTDSPPQALGDSRPEPVRVGELFRDARLPRWTWRVTERFGELYRLERVDKPEVVRFPRLAVLRDDNRYVRLPP